MRRLAGLATLLLLLTGCSGGAGDAETPAASGSASPTEQATPAPPPEVGECHRLSLDEAAQPVADDEAQVPCGRRSTSVTVRVAPLDLLDDGHLLSVDSPAATQRLARTCSPDLLSWAGGDQRTQRLSRLQVVWFAPSAEELELGADWVRCDLVAVGSDDRLLELPARTRGLLDRDGALDTYGTCGTASPAAGNFQRVACGQRHSWRAVDVVDLPADGRFLADDLTAAADSTCQDVASEASGGSLELTWAFEWPTRAQWDAGQRYGWCWVPEASSS